MQITCSNCQRKFDLDESLVGQTKAVACECGVRLPLVRNGEAPPRLGKYNLVHLIAKGGMGEIYYGKSAGVEGFEREVAIKRMLPHLASDRGFIEMMVKEAKLTVLLNHPNIVQVYDLARENDDYYIAMEYVPGITISSILEQVRAAKGLIPVEVAVHICLHLLRGLSYAHHFQLPTGEYQSIVHRDITPQNVLITARGYVKITDFGIAKAVGEISTTSPGLIKGKLGYIAPEQLMGHAPDHRVDLFCAAILLWEMLALRRLFKGLTEVDTFNLIAQCNIPDLKEYREDVPVELMQALQQALGRNPETRPQTADDIIRAINKAMMPRTADECAHVAEKYFHDNPQLFANLFVPNPEAAAKSNEDLSSVTLYFRRQKEMSAPPPATSAWLVAAAVCAGFVAIIGIAILVMVLNRRGDTGSQAVEQPQAVPAVNAPPMLEKPQPAQRAQADTLAAPIDAPPTPAAAKAVEQTSQRRHVSKRHDDDASMRPLTGAEIQAAVLKQQGTIVRCLKDVDSKGAPQQVAAHVTLATSGKVDEVVFVPALPGPTAACLAKALKGMRLRRHPVEGLEVTIPLKIQVF